MGRLVHTSLGSLHPMTHVLHYPHTNSFVICTAVINNYPHQNTKVDTWMLYGSYVHKCTLAMCCKPANERLRLRQDTAMLFAWVSPAYAVRKLCALGQHGWPTAYCAGVQHSQRAIDNQYSFLLSLPGVQHMRCRGY
jgi:hypothetical protein